MQGNERFTKSSGISSIVCSIPLFVFVTKFDHHHVGFLKKRLSTDLIHLCTETIPIGTLIFHPQDNGATIVTVFVDSVGRRETDGQLGVSDSLGYDVPPIRVNLA